MAASRSSVRNFTSTWPLVTVSPGRTLTDSTTSSILARSTERTSGVTLPSQCSYSRKSIRTGRTACTGMPFSICAFSMLTTRGGCSPSLKSTRAVTAASMTNTTMKGMSFLAKVTIVHSCAPRAARSAMA